MAVSLVASPPRPTRELTRTIRIFRVPADIHTTTYPNTTRTHTRAYATKRIGRWVLIATNGEFVVYRGYRKFPNDLSEFWTVERRERYLLRHDVVLPISLDRWVFPESNDAGRGAIDLVVTFVPTADSKAVTLKWRGWQLYEEDVPQSPEWHCLGYDVCDKSGTSGLTNCGYEEGDRNVVAGFATRVNEHHLFRTIEDADAFRDVSDRRVPEHAPFGVLAIYAPTSQVKLLSSPS
jgi:hypothetical protein